MRRRVILVFARAPVPGKTKTRLIPALGEEGAAALHRRLLVNTLAVVSELSGCDIELWCAPDCSHDDFQRLAEHYGCRLRTQQGEDLGERMANAMRCSLEQYPAAIVIGTDCPELTDDELGQGFAELEAGCDSVIGPAADGGYYLLGLKRFEPTLFNGVDWGSSRVLSQTLARLEQAGVSCTQLATKHDLDRPEDLERFANLLEGNHA